MGRTFLSAIVIVFLFSFYAAGKIYKTGEVVQKPQKIKIYDYDTKKVINSMTIIIPDSELNKNLPADVCYIVRKKGTERPFTGKYVGNHQKGVYHCVVCGLVLFISDTKFESGTGWPSFFQPVSKLNIKDITDKSLAVARTEVVCARCAALRRWACATSCWRCRTGRRPWPRACARWRRPTACA